MAVADTLADKFTGKVEQQEFTQIVGVDSGISGTTVQVFWRHLISARSMEQVFRFEGCTYAEAHTTQSITVKDIGGATYTFTPQGSVTDGSSGTLALPKEEVRVARVRVSPHMWNLEVRRTGTAYYSDNSKIINAPNWTGY